MNSKVGFIPYIYALTCHELKPKNHNRDCFICLYFSVAVYF